MVGLELLWSVKIWSGVKAWG